MSSISNVFVEVDSELELPILNSNDFDATVVSSSSQPMANDLERERRSNSLS